MCAFSDRFLVRYRERIICIRLSEVFLLQLQERVALSDGFLIRHRERDKIFCFVYSSKFDRMSVGFTAPIGCDRINSRFLLFPLQRQGFRPFRAPQV